jgi:hypothetical protein
MLFNFSHPLFSNLKLSYSNEDLHEVNLEHAQSYPDYTSIGWLTVSIQWIATILSIMNVLNRSIHVT